MTVLNWPLTSDLVLTSGTGTAAFTRATTGAYVDSAGAYLQVASDSARFTYDPLAAAVRGVWIERTRTNISIRSEDIDLWGTHFNVSITDGTALSGATKKITIYELTTTAQHVVTRGSTAISNGETYIASTFAKVISGVITTVGPRLNSFTTDSNAVASLINIVTPSIPESVSVVGTYTAPFGVSYQPYTGSWYRLEAGSSIASPNNLNPKFQLAGTIGTWGATLLSTGYTGTISSRVSMWGYQIEKVEADAKCSSSFIPTAAATVARNKDQLSLQVASNIATNDETIYFEWTPTSIITGTQALFGSWVDASNYTGIYHDGTANRAIVRRVIAATTTDASCALAPALWTTYKICARFSSSTGGDAFVDGTKGDVTDATTTACQLGTNFEIGADGNAANHGFGAFKNMLTFGSALSDSAIAALPSVGGGSVIPIMYNQLREQGIA